MSNSIRLPKYMQVAAILVVCYLVFYFIYVLQEILFPVIYAIMAAILVGPFVDFLMRRGINRILAVVITLIMVTVVAGGLIILIIQQASHFSHVFPELWNRLVLLFEEGTISVSKRFGIESASMDGWINEMGRNAMTNSSSTIGSSVSFISNTFATLLLTPVYFALVLYYQPRLLNSLHRIFGAANDENVGSILKDGKVIIRQYLMGILIEIGIVAVLNTVGLFFLGFEYALLLGIAGALLNVIPYLGGLITMFVYAAIALATKEPIYALYVIFVYGLIQFIDNNYIVPAVVGSKVRLNALASLMAVIAGAALCGIQGMFLSIPLLAVVKVVLDRFHSTKDLGFLLSVPESGAAKKNVLGVVANLIKKRSGGTK